MILDASALIAILDNQDAHHEAIADLLAEDAESPLHTHPLTLAEALVLPARMGREQAALTQLHDGIGITTVRPSSGLAPLDLARTRATTGLTMPDCIVLLTAENAREPLVTFDQRLAEAARARGVVALPTTSRA